MKDMLRYLEKLNEAAAECALIASLATNKMKKELFARLAEHLEFLAWEVEERIASADDE